MILLERYADRLVSGGKVYRPSLERDISGDRVTYLAQLWVSATREVYGSNDLDPETAGYLFPKMLENPDWFVRALARDDQNKPIGLLVAQTYPWWDGTIMGNVVLLYIRPELRGGSRNGALLACAFNKLVNWFKTKGVEKIISSTRWKLHNKNRLGVFGFSPTLVTYELDLSKEVSGNARRSKLDGSSGTGAIRTSRGGERARVNSPGWFGAEDGQTPEERATTITGKGQERTFGVRTTVEGCLR